MYYQSKIKLAQKSSKEGFYKILLNFLKTYWKKHLSQTVE